MSVEELKHSDVTGEIIGAAMEVHKVLGHGFLESVYEEALAIEFQIREIAYERQKPIDVYYKGEIIKNFIADMVVDNKIIVELKAIKKFGDYEMAQVINYIKSTNMEIGLLINFGARSLEFKRLILSQK